MAVDMTDSADGSAPALTLTLDVVHTPRIVNELQEHGKQTLDDDAHYHFFTPAGVTVDAKAFLALLASAGGSMKGLHIFAKGDPCENVLGLASCETLDIACRTASAPCEEDPVCTDTILGGGGFTARCCPASGATKQSGATCTGEGGCTGTCNGASTTTCTCAPPPPSCTAGSVCRAAVGHGDVAEVCTNGACPANGFKHNGARCPWFPKSHGRHGPYSVDVSSSRASKVTAEEAAARLSSAPSYLREWPSCEGTCIDGKCALRWDHPACCSIHKGTHYSEEEGQLYEDYVTAGSSAHGSGHWEGPEWYCWD